MNAWSRFWLAPGSARGLAAARILFSAHALWLLLSRDLPGVSGLPAELWTGVSLSSRWRYLLFEGHAERERALQALAVVALLAALLGLATRVSCFLAGLLLYHLAPLETIVLDPSPWLKGLTLSPLALIVLSLSPCADAWAVHRPASAAEDWEYGWPRRLLQFLVAQLYLFGGVAKLFQSGWRWASAANLRAWLLLANQDPQLVVFRGPGLWLADHPALCALAGIFGLALDLGFILVLVSSRARRLLVPAAVLFHLGILLSMNYVFLEAPLLLVFVGWNRVSKDGGSPGGAAGPPPSGLPPVDAREAPRVASPG